MPTLSLGIPGDSVMAVLLGALMIHGITPGPALVNEHPTLFWGWWPVSGSATSSA
ncbi:MAG: tripartite tricarboxylate transporter permease [Paracoccaceae bacterium]